MQDNDAPEMSKCGHPLYYAQRNRVVLLVSKMLWPLLVEVVEDFQSVKSSENGPFPPLGCGVLATEMGDRGITGGDPPTSDKPLEVGREDLKSDGARFDAFLVPLF